MMIYTITFNPAIDYTVWLKTLKLGQTNRTYASSLQVGGKGINVAIILSRLDTKNIKTSGFLGTENNDLIVDTLRQEDIFSNFIMVEGKVRINLKIKSAEETEINANGPLITPEDWKLFLEQVNKFNIDDLVIISGSLANGMTSQHLEELLKLLNDKTIKFSIDMERDNLLTTLAYRPLLIKPNLEELEAICEQKLKTDEDIIANALKLQDVGATNILVSLGAMGAIYVSSKQEIYYVTAGQGKLVNSVGAGDAMFAAFIASHFIWHKSIAESLQIASASGSATSFTKWLATKAEIEFLIKTIKVKQVGS